MITAVVVSFVRTIAKSAMNRMILAVILRLRQRDRLGLIFLPPSASSS